MTAPLESGRQAAALAGAQQIGPKFWRCVCPGSCYVAPYNHGVLLIGEDAPGQLQIQCSRGCTHEEIEQILCTKRDLLQAKAAAAALGDKYPS
jgi:hypothetical protein